MQWKMESNAAIGHVQVHLDTWPASMSRLQFDDVVSSPSNNGDGFAFINNTIGNLRGRGILCKWVLLTHPSDLPVTLLKITHKTMAQCKGITPESLPVCLSFTSEICRCTRMSTLPTGVESDI